MNEKNSKKMANQSPETPASTSQKQPRGSSEMEKESSKTSTEAETRQEQPILRVDISRINVPRERVTSVWTPELEQEFIESVKAKGILKPLDLININGAYWLTDGLHRILAAEKLGMSKVPCRIKKGSLEDLLIENIIMNRQRGKSNPAQEAETLAYLVTKRNYPLETASKQMGFSPSWAKKLLRIAELPEEAKDLIKHGKIPITGAFYIVDLPTPQEQLSVARDAAQWSYSVYQIKAKVASLLNPDVEPDEGSYTFNSQGKPNKIPIRCEFCGVELPDVGKRYRWICSNCEPLLFDLHKSYVQALAEVTSKPSN